MSELLFNKKVVIDASAMQVWHALTEPLTMTQWMSENEIEVITDWQPGSQVIIRGAWYKTGFENRGIVLQHELGRVLEYTHLSSLSRLPDVPDNHSVFLCTLQPLADETVVSISIRNFPTETIYKHLAFYWNVALELLKKFVEQNK